MTETPETLVDVVFELTRDTKLFAVDSEGPPYYEGEVIVGQVYRDIVKRRIAHVLASRSAFSGIPRTENEHRCGVRGFDGMKGDVCPACSVISSASPLSEDEARAIESLRHLTMGQKAGRADYVGSLNLRDAKILYDLLTKD